MFLAFQPGFELADGFAFFRQLDLGVAVVHVAGSSRGVAENLPADLLEYAREHHPGICGVPKIVEPDVADASAPETRRPGSLDDLDRVAVVGEDETLGAAHGCEHVVQTLRERNLARFAFGGFRVADMEDAIVEIDVLPSLGKDLSPAHPGVERTADDPLEMFGRGSKEQVLFAD